MHEEEKEKREQLKNTKAVICLCTALLCNFHYPGMSLIQKLLSIVSYTGHSPPQKLFISIVASTVPHVIQMLVYVFLQVFTRLQNLFLTISHQTLITTVTELGKDHDEQVLQ